MRNRQYKKTEEKILAVFFNHPDYTMWQLAKKVGIARSTIYTHHHSNKQIILDYEKYILTEYRQIFKKDIEIKKVYLSLLIFILQNRKFFELFLKFDDREILIKMFTHLKPRLNMAEKVFRIFVAEVTEVIFEWGEEGFSENKLGNVLSDMMYLTKTARDRLGPIE